MHLTCLYWSLHCIYVPRRRCRWIISETAMQLIYFKCRSTTFWIYIFLFSLFGFQHNGETKNIDVPFLYLCCFHKCFLKLWVLPDCNSLSPKGNPLHSTAVWHVCIEIRVTSCFPLLFIGVMCYCFPPQRLLFFLSFLMTSWLSKWFLCGLQIL